MSGGHPQYLRLTEAQRQRFEAQKCPDPNGPDHGEGEVLYHVKGDACAIAHGDTRIDLGGDGPYDTIIFPTFVVPQITPDIHAQRVNIWHVCGTKRVHRVLVAAENEPLPPVITL